MNQEALLIQRAARGDPEAFDALMAPHLPRAYRVAWLITRDSHSASDALQEALVRVYRSLKCFRPGSALYPWFARIVVNEAIKQARGGRHQLVPLPDLAATEDLTLPGRAHTQSPESAVELWEERRLLWQAIQQLPPRHRAVIVLRYYEELSETEMAEMLQVSPGTVKSRLYHARLKLERLLVRHSDRSQAPVPATEPVLDGGEGLD